MKGGMNCKGTWQNLWATGKLILIVVTVSWVLTLCQSWRYPILSIYAANCTSIIPQWRYKNDLMGIGSPLGPKPTIPNNGNNLYQKDLIVSTGYKESSPIWLLLGNILIGISIQSMLDSDIPSSLLMNKDAYSEKSTSLYVSMINLRIKPLWTRNSLSRFLIFKALNKNNSEVFYSTYQLRVYFFIIY